MDWSDRPSTSNTDTDVVLTSRPSTSINKQYDNNNNNNPPYSLQKEQQKQAFHELHELVENEYNQDYELRNQSRIAVGQLVLLKLQQQLPQQQQLTNEYDNSYNYNNTNNNEEEEAEEMYTKSNSQQPYTIRNTDDSIHSEDENDNVDNEEGEEEEERMIQPRVSSSASSYRNHQPIVTTRMGEKFEISFDSANVHLDNIADNKNNRTNKGSNNNESKRKTESSMFIAAPSSSVIANAVATSASANHKNANTTTNTNAKSTEKTPQQILEELKIKKLKELEKRAQVINSST